MQLGLAVAVGIALGAAGYALLSRQAQDAGSGASGGRSAREEAPVGAAAHPAETGSVQLPEIPISLNHVEARSGRGYVVQFHNQSQKHLAVLVELENKTLSQHKSGPLQLAPGQMVELGGTPEWTFVSGETVTVRLDGHRTKVFEVP
jgi:hypothetical protein